MDSDEIKLPEGVDIDLLDDTVDYADIEVEKILEDIGEYGDVVLEETVPEEIT